MLGDTTGQGHAARHGTDGPATRTMYSLPHETPLVEEQGRLAERHNSFLYY